MFEKLKKDWVMATTKERIRFLVVMVSFYVLGAIGIVSSWGGYYYYKMSDYKSSAQCLSFTVIIITVMYFLSRVKLSPEHKK